MKLKVGDVVYLQKYEVDYLIKEKNNFKASILQEIFETDQNASHADRYSFSCAFSNEANVKWLMAQKWIVDYVECRRLPLHDLKLIMIDLRHNLDREITDFNHRPSTYRDKNIKKEAARFQNEHYKIQSLGVMIEHLEGKINFVFPKDIIPYAY